MSTASVATPDGGSVTPLRGEEDSRRQRVEDLDRWSTETGKLVQTGVAVAHRGRTAVAEAATLGEWQDCCRALGVAAQELRRWDGRGTQRVWVERHHGPYTVRIQVDAAIALDEDPEARAERARAAAADAL